MAGNEFDNPSGIASEFGKVEMSGTIVGIACLQDNRVKPRTRLEPNDAGEIVMLFASEIDRVSFNLSGKDGNPLHELW